MDMGGKDSYETQLRKHREAAERYHEKLEVEQKISSWLPTVNRPTPKREKEKVEKMSQKYSSS